MSNINQLIKQAVESVGVNLEPTLKSPTTIILEKILDYFYFINYDKIKNEINFSYDITSGLSSYKNLIHITNNLSNNNPNLVIKDQCFDYKTKAIVRKSPEAQLKNFKNFLILTFGISDELKGWTICFDIVYCPPQEF